jgi:hypothetical protein
MLILQPDENWQLGKYNFDRNLFSCPNSTFKLKNGIFSSPFRTTS